MNRLKELNNALDKCLEHLLVEGKTIEQCLLSFPEHADKLKPLLETALVTKQASSIQPRSEFRDKARYQFYSALQEIERRKSRSFFSWSWQPRWATAVAIFLALFLASGGAAAAASGSMPDDLLYPVKMATERVQLAFTFSTLGKAELHAKLADKRVMEIIYLADKSKPEKIALTTDSLSNHLTAIAVLFSPQEAIGEEGTALTVREAPAPTVEAPLMSEEPSALEEVPALEEAPAAREVLPEKALAVEEAPLLPKQVKGSKEADVKVDRQAEFKMIIARQADNNLARLHALLKTAPESAKPALRQAITILETDYEKILESLD